MATRSTFGFPLSLPALLVALTLAACGSGGGSDPQGNGSAQHIDGSDAGAGGKPTKDPSAVDKGGSQTQPGDEGSGNTGSVGEPDEGEDEPDPDESGDGGSGGRDANEGSAGAGGDGPEPTGPSEAFLRGQALVTESQCVTCHQQNFAGFSVFPNITPDETTGIGSWTDAQIVAAIRDGIDADGSSMCVTMQRYAFDDAQAADVVAFLRGLPAVSNRIAGACPGHGN